MTSTVGRSKPKNTNGKTVLLWPWHHSSPVYQYEVNFRKLISSQSVSFSITHLSGRCYILTFSWGAGVGPFFCYMHFKGSCSWQRLLAAHFLSHTLSLSLFSFVSLLSLCPLPLSCLLTHQELCLLDRYLQLVATPSLGGARLVSQAC